MDLSAIIDEFNRRKAQAGQRISDMFTLPKKPADWFEQMQQGQNAVITPEQRSNAHKELADIAERMAQGMVPEPIRARERASRTDPSAAAKPFTSEEIKQATPFVTAAAPIAYHGTPHTFDKFDASKIGTGQGAQSYGHGLYFAENPQVAKSYTGIEDALSFKGISPEEWAKGNKGIASKVEKAFQETGSLDAALQKLKQTNTDAAEWMQRNKANITASNTGNTYQVNIPDQHAAKMLDWDKPLSEQPQIAKAIASIVGPDKAELFFAGQPAKWTGGEAYKELADFLGGQRILAKGVGGYPVKYANDAAASAKLGEAGIPGIKYLDQGSRTAGQGTRNFVVFDPAILEDLTRK